MSAGECDVCDGSGRVPCARHHLPGRAWMCDACQGKREVRCMACVARATARAGQAIDLDPLALEFGPEGAR